MATTPVPAFAAPPDFPALSDRATGTYNSKAYAWATAIQGTTGPNIHAIALTAKANADDAALSAGDAAAQVLLAAGQVSLAAWHADDASDHADRAEDMADAAAANAAYKGDWASLSGALAVPATVTHSSDRYVLLSSVANVAAHQPGVSAVWQKLTVAQEKLVSGTNIKTVGGQSLLGSGDITLGGTSIVPMVLTTNTTLVKADAGKTINLTGSMTGVALPLAATAGSGWFVILSNKRTLLGGATSTAVTVSRSGSNTIDTQTTMPIQAGLSYMIFCDGTGYTAVKIGGAGLIMLNSGTSWTCPAGVVSAKISCIGGGGGGGGGHASGGRGSGGGAGGMGTVFVSLVPGTAYTYAIGAGGNGGGVGSNGSGGGNTTFATSAGNITGGGGNPGSAGAAASTTPVQGGDGGGGSAPQSEAGFAEYGQPGGLALGTIYPSGGPGRVVKGNIVARGGDGGSVGGAGAIIIEY